MAGLFSIKAIAMPIKTGVAIDPVVMQWVSAIGAPIHINSMTPTNGTEREFSINLNRHVIQQSIRATGLANDDLVLLVDSDVIATPEMIARLVDHLDGDTICVATETKGLRISGHAVTACAVIRYCDYAMIQYLQNPYQCQCLKIAMFGKITVLEQGACEIQRTFASLPGA